MLAPQLVVARSGFLLQTSHVPSWPWRTVAFCCNSNPSRLTCISIHYSATLLSLTTILYNEDLWLSILMIATVIRDLDLYVLRTLACDAHV